MQGLLVIFYFFRMVLFISCSTACEKEFVFFKYCCKKLTVNFEIVSKC